MDFDMKDCGGCITCEIACSYKHKGEFNHLLSSIEIVEKKDEPGYKVRLIEDPSSGRIPCDACVNCDDEPMCMKYCPKKEQLEDILNRFKAQCLQQKKERD